MEYVGGPRIRKAKKYVEVQKYKLLLELELYQDYDTIFLT